jgi:hypothetical protein
MTTDDSTRTSTDGIIGSSAYMAPEQVRGGVDCY